ncbi:hypothetical protein JA1_001810 [Spathaspora sp. JA1]|nr:hypothetical protein JA1_001810 [Spathaspora sp. JA1]
MSSRQLNHLEVESPQLMPYSDILWKRLIEREFPERTLTLPLDVRYMPYKSLFEQYVRDREEFKQDSAERLRSITHRLARNKNRNKVVKLDQVLKDPTIRRRPVQRVSGKGSGSILSKVRRDMQSRSIMFNKSGAVKKYDPFDGFRVDQSPVKRTAVKRTTFFDGNEKPIPKATTNTTNNTTTNIATPVNTTPTLPKKRKAEPSIFLKSKRSLPSPKHKRKPTPPPTKLKQIKSSIFS